MGDFLGHVDRGVCAYEREGEAEEADHEGGALGLPAADVEEEGEDRAGGEDGKGDEDGEEDGFDVREEGAQNGVDSDTDEDDGSEEERAVPLLGDVGRVVEDEKTLDHGAARKVPVARLACQARTLSQPVV